DVADTAVDRPPPRVGLALEQTRVALPLVTVGEQPMGSELVVVETAGVASQGGLEIVVEGAFAVMGSTQPLMPGERRPLVVEYTGQLDEPQLVVGRAELTVDGQTVSAELGLVVGHPALPPRPTWTEHDYGEMTVVSMPSAPYPYPEDGPWQDDSVVVAVPDGFSDRGPVDVVAHLHGLRADVAQVVAQQQIVEMHAQSGRNAIFIAPQGPYRAASNDFGRLDEPDGFRRLVEDTIALLYREGRVTTPAVGDTVVTAHSGGYKPTSQILLQGGLPILSAHLFDALYAREAIFQDYVLEGGMLRSSYTTTGGTVDNNEALIGWLQEQGIPFATTTTDGALLDHAVVIAFSPFSHSGCVRGDRSYARWLRTSGLARSPLAPPELLTTLHHDEEDALALVQWRDDGAAAPMRVQLEGSLDGQTWVPLADTTATQATVPAYPWLRLIALDDAGQPSMASDRYGATGRDWLVVDGFDRRLGGSWSVPSHGFAAVLGQALGAPFSVASNEAVAEGWVSLEGFERVLWMLGDESLDDVTFDDAERAALEDFLEGGGQLIVTGSEVGYATDADWLQRVLHVRYIQDNAGTQRAEGFTF
ncbi:MAG: hypothetical protein AAFX99_34535, partial [Myxococcota bacterium]